MRQRRAATIRDLRTAIDCLPRRTRVAMLAGIDASPIIVGAYADKRGVCPMLAAHRNGGRTAFIGFAKAWDAFAFAGVRPSKRRARPATPHELTVLRAHLQASLLADESPADLEVALREHRALVGRPRTEPVPQHTALEREVAEHGRWKRLARRRQDERATALVRG